MRHLRPRKRMSKAKNQRYHAKVRALQRYAVKLTNYDLDRMAEIYRHSSDTIKLYKQSNRVTKALITYNGVVYPIIYDRHRKQIVTILKPEYLHGDDRKKYESRVAALNLQLSEVKNPVLPNDVKIDIEDNEQLTEELSEEEKQVESDYVEITDDDQTLMQEAMDKLNF